MYNICNIFQKILLIMSSIGLQCKYFCLNLFLYMVVIFYLCCNFILQYKIWLKFSVEQQFVYGYYVMKFGLGRIIENILQYEGVVVYSMNDFFLVWMYLFKRIQFFLKCLLFFIKKKFLVDYIFGLIKYVCLQGFGVVVKFI